MLHGLQVALGDMEAEFAASSPDGVGLICCRTLRASLTERWQERRHPKSTWVTAAILDPRFKLIAFLPQAQQQQAFKHVISLARAEAAKVAAAAAANAPAPVAAPAPEPVDALSQLCRLDYSTVALPLPPEDTDASKEFLAYLHATVRVGDDPLVWWGKRERDFPIIARLAMRYLCIPATSAPSERMFSAAGLVLDRRRARMQGSRARAILFLHGNMHCMPPLVIPAPANSASLSSFLISDKQTPE
jgi:hypothetical protein